MTEWVGKRYGLDGPGHGPGPAELPAQQPPNFKQFYIDVNNPFGNPKIQRGVTAEKHITLSLTSHACGNIGAIFPRQLNEFYDDLGWDRGGDVPERERRNEKNMVAWTHPSSMSTKGERMGWEAKHSESIRLSSMWEKKRTRTRREKEPGRKAAEMTRRRMMKMTRRMG
ncbi:unnamed protein product [Zymoseptoria tritici ST99CH_1A5]|uniref:Uncharacterized protein n=1 Tax=Zymoseptoria tritici ST99CH_1A5 TaxID=1276529 RepID=A0A1Y6M1I1_ZYMTR|nr:unnamed protein product [Zymoseptoria tritici ST99CH_1A5]